MQAPLETKISIFFGRFAIYIIAALVAACLVLGIGWYVTAIRYDGQVHKADAIKTQLEVSNASYKSIKTQFQMLTDQLEANQEKALASHELLQNRLKSIMDADKTRMATEDFLLNRKPETECKTPEDLKNAWNKM